MKLRTLQEWNERGRWIVKGNTAKETDKDGNALFSKDQTKRVRTLEEWNERGRFIIRGSKCIGGSDRGGLFSKDQTVLCTPNSSNQGRYYAYDYKADYETDYKADYDEHDRDFDDVFSGMY